VTRAGLRLLTLAWFAWALCFGILRHWSTWTPFAFAGPFLATAALAYRAVPRALLRPSLANVMVGVAAGALMVVATHLAYRLLVTFTPAVAGATRQLLSLLNVVGFSAGVRALLIVLIASCEEVLFRGLLPSSTAPGPGRPHWPSRREFAQITGFAAVYAVTTLPLGSALLVMCALACGSAWGVMRVATNSLVVPLLAHVVWDLGVLLLWPLAGQVN
jgi:uncharacterized protein